MSEQYRITFGGYNSWVLPLNLAVGFHLLIAFSVVVVPDLFKPSPKYEDIYTVDLVNLAEPAVEQSAPPAPVPEPAPLPEPEVSEEAVAITDPITPAPPQVEEVKPVSLKPSKRKIKKKVKDPQRDRQKELERIKRQRLAEAVQAEQLAAEQARIAAEEAERQRKLAQAELNRIRNQVRSAPAPGPPVRRSGSSNLSALETQYYLNVTGKIANHWALPEFKRFDDSIQAIYVIKISRNGTIIDEFFERRSGDPTYDQFVKKAIRESKPLPPIPPAIKSDTIEFGLVFKPGGIQ
ncbi:MAG: TonB C-terminal domain-containing protein [Desulfofustis sp.]|nr:TonB C-terminal domain-containing protein [Desulfofustis sp.]NNF48150.1 hypothetical protein [Desulfofustis sp.]